MNWEKEYLRQLARILADFPGICEHDAREWAAMEADHVFALYSSIAS